MSIFKMSLEEYKRKVWEVKTYNNYKQETLKDRFISVSELNRFLEDRERIQLRKIKQITFWFVYGPIIKISLFILLLSTLIIYIRIK